MYKIINKTSDKTILLTPKVDEFIDFIQKIFRENCEPNSIIMPKKEIGCIKYINEYCDNLTLYVG